jgi:tRNA nucleotidyltransferase (CCA-adding enzyme)
MKTFGIQPSRQIGEIKEVITEAILEGSIPNDFDAAFQLMVEEGKKHGLTPLGT